MQTRSTDARMRITSRDEAGTLVLALSGEIDLVSVEPLNRALEQAARHGGTPVALDLSAVCFADTSLVNALLRARPRLDGGLRLIAPSERVTRLLRVLGLHALFETRGGPGDAPGDPGPSPCDAGAHGTAAETGAERAVGPGPYEGHAP